MDSILKHGELVPPSSLYIAKRDRLRAQREVDNIKEQLADPTRPLKYPNTAAYDKWAASAKRALKTRQSEVRQLTEWIDLQESDLLLQAHTLLCKLRDGDDENEPVELFDDELALIDRIGKHLDEQRRRAA